MSKKVTHSLHAYGKNDCHRAYCQNGPLYAKIPRRLTQEHRERNLDDYQVR